MQSRLRLAPVLVGAVLAVVGAASCAHDEANAPAAAPKVLTAVDYYPLAIGNRWTYRPEPAPKGTPDQVVEITAQDAEGFFVTNGGSRVAHRKLGVFDGDRFILQDPLQKGHGWMAVPSVSAVENYEITDTGLAVATPAGFFDDCVRVKATTQGRTETGQSMTLELVWTYAPGVGLIRLIQRAAVGDGKMQDRARLTLMKFEPAAESTP